LGLLPAWALLRMTGTNHHCAPNHTPERRNHADLFAGPTVVASYEVDPDCAGRLVNPDGSVFGHFVVVDGGKEFFGLSLSPGNSVNVVWKKINKED